MEHFEGRLKKTLFEFEDETDRFGMSRSSSVDRVSGVFILVYPSQLVYPSLVTQPFGAAGEKKDILT